jgi:hypothetical protein
MKFSPLFNFKMGPYEKIAFDKEKAIKENTFKGKEMSDNEFNKFIKDIEDFTNILKDDKLFEAERKKYVK